MDKAVHFHDLSVSRRTEGRFHEAVPLCMQALAIVEHAVGPHHPDVANVLNTLSSLYCDLGDYAEAERLARRSMALMEEATGSAEIEVLRVQSLGTLAGIYRVQGRYTAAEPLYQRALSLAEAALGPKDLEVATCLNNLAVLYKDTGQFATAQPLYRRALAITQRALGPDHPDVAAIYHNLGGLEHARGKYAKGEPFARKAVALREQALGPDHPDVAADVAALAAILDGLRKYDEAEASYRRALTIFERVYGPEHYEVAERICRELGLDDLISRMPAGLLQMVGETGWQLSHGERSRLYMARALLQAADLVILDESFAALDPETLQRYLRCVLNRTATVLVIAHP